MTSNDKPSTTSDDRPDGAYARPGDPQTNTRPPGNGDRDERDSDRAVEKLNEVGAN
jgi:hypothetical protein